MRSYVSRLHGPLALPLTARGGPLAAPTPETVSVLERAWYVQPAVNRASLHRRLLVSFAVWTAYALLYTVQQIVILHARGGESVSLPRLFGQQLAFFAPWALATPLVLRLGERFPIHRARWLAPLAIHLGAIIALTALHCVAIVAVEPPRDFDSVMVSWVG